MMPARSHVLIAAMLIAVTGCTTAGGNAGPGIALGAFAGQRSSAADTPAASALIAALNGGIIDRNVNARLDRAARATALQAEYQALEYTPAGEAVAWRDDGDSARGEVVASQPYRVGSQNCRQYTHTVYLSADGANRAQGTACRNPDGSWTPLT